LQANLVRMKTTGVQKGDMFLFEGFSWTVTLIGKKAIIIQCDSAIIGGFPKSEARKLIQEFKKNQKTLDSLASTIN